MEMLFLPYLHYLSFLVCVGSIFYILIKDYKAPLNIACALFLSCFALWSFGMIFIHNANTPLEAVNLWYNINCFGWIFFSYFFFWFTIIYIENKKIFKWKWLIVLFSSLPFFLVYKKWTGDIFDYYILMPHGWEHVWLKSVWTYIFYAYYMLTMFLSLGLFFAYWKNVKYKIKKKQTKIIIISVIIALCLGSIFSVLLPNLNYFYFPALGDVCSLIWVAGVVYSISKYNFLNITPEKAAKNIMNTMSDALIILNKDGYIAGVNKAVLRLSNHKEKNLLNKSISFLFKEEKLRDKVLLRAENGELYKNENLTFKTKGNLRNIPVLFSTSLLKNIDNSLAGIVCIAKDISDIKKIEKNLEEKNIELAESVKKLEESKKKINNAIDKIDGEKRKIDEEKNKILSIISSFHDPIMVFDKYSQISYMNQEAKNIFGFSDDMIGRKYFLRDFSMSNLADASKVDFSVSKGNELISGDTRDGVEELIIHNQKKELTYKVITVKMIDGEEYFGFIKIFHSLTREKEMDKLKSEFISIAAHQLRTPLSAVKWVIKMIIDGDAGSLSKEQKELLEKGYTNNERIIKLVNDLLYVSRIEEGRFGYTLKDDDYLEVVKNSLSEQEKLYKNKKLNLVYDIPEKLPKLNIDRERIDLVLKNLFSNCRKYTPENGRVKLIVKQEDDFVITKIIDNGIGIPEKEEKRLFEKFFRASNVVRTQTSGSGLGLYISKNIIKKHGGDIKIKSREGKGTEIEFSLPIKKYQNFNI